MLPSRRVLTIAICASALSCASPSQFAHSPFEGPSAAPAMPAAATLSVVVSNEHWLSMQVWVYWPGMRRFLGDVAPGSSTTFQVPGDLVRRFESLRLYADPTGSAEDVLTDPLDVRGGRRIEWRLRKMLLNSHARVI